MKNLMISMVIALVILGTSCQQIFASDENENLVVSGKISTMNNMVDDSWKEMETSEINPAMILIDLNSRKIKVQYLVTYANNIRDEIEVTFSGFIRSGIPAKILYLKNEDAVLNFPENSSYYIVSSRAVKYDKENKIKYTSKERYTLFVVR